MKYCICISFCLLLQSSFLFAQYNNDFNAPGTVSIGTRNTFSMFNDDPGVGKGIGGQTRVQVSDRINTEWFFDYISSKNKTFTNRNDYHVGWSIMYYPGSTVDFSNLLQPYLLVGHCFDYTRLSEQKNKSNYADRWTMATQAGLGTHINITSQLDCSVSAQYMLHFGKEITATIEKDIVSIEKKNYSSPDGHLLFSVSFNYKLFHLW
ncbi:MAG: outer membrane beta-barrel protein [Ferruginibacter sp.]